MFIIFFTVLFSLLALYSLFRCKELIIKSYCRFLIILGFSLIIIGLAFANFIMDMTILNSTVFFRAVKPYFFEIAFYMSPVGLIVISLAIILGCVKN